MHYSSSQSQDQDSKWGAGGNVAGRGAAPAVGGGGTDTTTYMYAFGIVGFIGMCYVNGGWRARQITPGYDSEARFNPRI